MSMENKAARIVSDFTGLPYASALRTLRKTGQKPSSIINQFEMGYEVACILITSREYESLNYTVGTRSHGVMTGFAETDCDIEVASFGLDGANFDGFLGELQDALAICLISELEGESRLKAVADRVYGWITGSELGAEFSKHFTLSDDGKTFEAVVKNQFRVTGRAYVVGQKVNFDSRLLTPIN